MRIIHNCGFLKSITLYLRDQLQHIAHDQTENALKLMWPTLVLKFLCTCTKCIKAPMPLGPKVCFDIFCTCAQKAQNKGN